MRKVISIILAAILTLGTFYQPILADTLPGAEENMSEEDTNKESAVPTGEEKPVREMEIKGLMNGFAKFPYGEIWQEEKYYSQIAMGSSLTITYEDGTKKEWIQPFQWEENSVSVYVADKDTKEVIDGSVSGYLPVGNYELYARCGGMEILIKEFFILPVEEFYQGDLRAGGSVESAPAENAYLAFKFVAEKQGDYQFTQAMGTPSDNSFQTYLLDSQGKKITGNSGDGSYRSQWIADQLPAGEYWLLAKFYTNYKSVTITAKEAVHEVTALQTGGRLMHDGVIPAGRIYQTAENWNSTAAQGLYVKFIYEDGASGKSIYPSDWKKSGIEGILKDQQGNIVEDQGYSKTLPVGKYQLYAKYGDITTLVTDFEVKPPSECFDEILSLNHPAEFGEVLYRTRIVRMGIEKDGHYLLSARDGSSQLRHITIHDAEGKALKTVELPQGKSVRIELKADEYYLYFYAPEMTVLSLEETSAPSAEKFEISGTSSYHGIFAEGEISKRKSSVYTIMKGFRVKIVYTDGSKSESIFSDQYEAKGIELWVRDRKTGEEISMSGNSFENLPKGSYEAVLRCSDFSEKVMDFEVKSQEECADYTLSMNQPLAFERLSDQRVIVKLTADEDAVYFFNFSPEGGRFHHLKSEQAVYVKTNISDKLRVYLPKGNYYLYFESGSALSLSVSAEKKRLANMELTNIPPEEQRIFRQDEMSSVGDVIDAESKLHQGIQLRLSYEDGSQETIGYEEFLTLVWRETCWGRKDGKPMNMNGKDTGSYYQSFDLPGRGSANKTPKLKFWVYKGFDDVSEADWYLNYAARISAEGIMTGLNETTFGGTVTLRRSHVATILYRLAGSQKIDFESRFPDVGSGDFYSLPVTWCSQNGIVTGYSNGCFGPDDDITREQLALMLYRYADYQGYDVSDKGDLKAFPDDPKVSDFAREAMQWAVGAGLIKGNNGNLSPQGGAARAEAATMILRFMDKYDL